MGFTCIIQVMEEEMKRKLSLLLVLFCALLLVASPAFAVQLIQTADIADGAVTNAKIADGAVTDAKISGVISSSKLDGSTLDVDTVDGKHAADFAGVVHGHGVADVTGLTTELDAKANNADLATKADAVHGHGIVDVTGLQTELDAKATVADLATKADSADLATKADNNHGHDAADLLTGVISTDKLATYAGVKVVHKGAADGQNTFNTINDALAQMSDSSETNRYILFVMPGLYIEDVHFPHGYIDIIGQSKESVTIQGTGAGTYAVSLSANSTLKNVTIEGSTNYLVYVTHPGAVLENCNVVISKSSGSGVYYLQSLNAALKNVRISTAPATIAQSALRINGGGTTSGINIVDDLLVEGSYMYAVVVYGDTASEEPLKIKNTTIKNEAGTALVSYGLVDFENVNFIMTDTPLNGRAALEVYSYTNLVSSAICRSCYFEGPESVRIGGHAEFYNSVFNGQVKTAIGSDGMNGNIKIANSQIEGGLANYNGLSPMGIKVVNSSDGNFDPIADGEY